MCIHHNPEDLFIVSGPGGPVPRPADFFSLPAAWQTGSVGYGLGTGLGKAGVWETGISVLFNYLNCSQNISMAGNDFFAVLGDLTGTPFGIGVFLLGPT